MTVKNLDISDIFGQLKTSQLDPSVFDRVDERHIIKAPNLLTWAIGPQFLNTTILPRQIEAATKLLAEYCPRCSNPGYIDTLFDQSIGNIRDNIMFLEHGVCPKCKVSRFELIKGHELVQYTELVGGNGQRSGKSKLVGLLGTYINHRFLKIPNPLRHYKLPTGEILVGTFSGMTAENARDNLWEPFNGFIEASPWFQSYHRFLKEEGKRLSIELVKDLQSFKYYTHKRILWHYTGSQAAKLRGKTRIFGAIDEIGWMVSDELKKNLTIMDADKLYTALSNSLATLRMRNNKHWSARDFDSFPPILMANISSPSSAKDKIMRLLKDAAKNPKILAFNLATWECVHENTIIHTGSSFDRAITASFDRPFEVQRSTKAMVEVTTRLGYTIRCTPEHLIKVFDGNSVGFKSASTLTPADLAIIDYRAESKHGTTPEFAVAPNRSSLGRPSVTQVVMGEEFLRFLGILAAEGTISNQSDYEYNKVNKYQRRVTIYNTDQEVLAAVARDCAVAFPNTACGIKWVSDRAWEKIKSRSPNAKRIGRVVLNSVVLIDTLASLDVGTERLAAKTTPAWVFKSPPKLIGAYLSGLFEGDGWVYAGKVNIEIGFCSTSRSLRDTCRDLLLQLGIPSVSYEHQREKPASEFFELRIRGPEMLRRFRDKVGFLSSTKNLKLANAIYLAELRPRRPFYWNRIPASYVKYLKEKYCIPSWKIPGGSQKSIVRELVSKPDIDDYQALSDGTLLDPVLSVKDVGVGNVVDYSFRNPPHEYWSAGFISHNCNPDYTYESLREEFAHMSDSDFDRDFGASPPLESEPFLTEIKLVDRMATLPPFEPLKVEPITKEDSFGDRYMTVLPIFTGLADKRTPRMATFDLGTKKNAYGFCLFSQTKEGKVKLDFALEISPTKGLRVNTADVFDFFVVPLVNHFNVKYAFFDRWQSLDQVLRLRNMKVDAGVHSLSYKEIDMVRGVIMADGILIPKLDKTMTEYVKEYIEDESLLNGLYLPTLGIQILTVRDSGTKFLKPLAGDDDVFRAFCLGVVMMQVTEVKKAMEPPSSMLLSGHSVAALGTVRKWNPSKQGHGVGGTMVHRDDGKGSLGMIRSLQKRRPNNG